jgi:hypothetical protein
MGRHIKASHDKGCPLYSRLRTVGNVVHFQSYWLALITSYPS